MTVINIRGTGGSGKSTVVRRIMELYPCREALPRSTGKRPRGYLLSGRLGTLLVPGHYETPTGGCDTLKTVDEVYEMIWAAVRADPPQNVLYEGIMVQDDLSRAVKLDRWMRESVAIYGQVPDEESRLNVIRLNTPIEVSLAGVRARREARGDERPLDEKNTRARHETQVRMESRLRAAGVAVEALDREAAYRRVCALLRLGPGASYVAC